VVSLLISLTEPYGLENNCGSRNNIITYEANIQTSNNFGIKQRDIKELCQNITLFNCKYLEINVMVSEFFEKIKIRAWYKVAKRSRNLKHVGCILLSIPTIQK